MSDEEGFSSNDFEDEGSEDSDFSDIILDSQNGEASSSKQELSDRIYNGATRQALPYAIERRNGRRWSKNVIIEKNYSVHFNESWGNKTILQGNEELQEIFDEIVREINRDVPVTGVVGININHPDLNNSIVIRPMPVAEINGNIILEEVVRVLNSNESLDILKELDIRTTTLNNRSSSFFGKSIYNEKTINSQK